MTFYIGLMIDDVLTPANDNAPDGYDPRDWDEFDPAELPADAVWDDDAPLTTLQMFALIAGENIADFG
jgi:hypothetical protein